MRTDVEACGSSLHACFVQCRGIQVHVLVPCRKLRSCQERVLLLSHWQAITFCDWGSFPGQLP